MNTNEFFSHVEVVNSDDDRSLPPLHKQTMSKYKKGPTFDHRRIEREKE